MTMKPQKEHRRKIQTAFPGLTISIWMMSALVCLGSGAAPRESGAGSKPALGGRAEGSLAQPTDDAATSVSQSSPVSLPREDSEDPVTASPRLILRWVDPGGLFSIGSKTLGSRVRAIFEGIGVQTTWREGDEMPLAESSAVRVRVFLLPTEPTACGLSSNAMGVVLSRTTPQDAVYIFFPSVARTLGYRPQELIRHGGLSVGHAMVLARALSRVVAHEVIHAVAPALAHGPKGLTKGKLDRHSLTATGSAIHPRSAEIFRSELRKLTTHCHSSLGAKLPVSRESRC